MLRTLELKVPPLLLCLVVMALIYGIDQLLPQTSIAALKGVGFVLLALSLAVLLSAVFAVRRAKTTINPTRPEDASTLLTTGIYQFSRNPMYLAFVLLLLAWSALLTAPIGFVLAALFAIYLNQFQIKPEERILESKFSQRYIDYRQRVRRWL